MYVSMYVCVYDVEVAEFRRHLYVNVCMYVRMYVCMYDVEMGELRQHLYIKMVIDTSCILWPFV
jgi:hypothetical protein